MVFPLRYSQSVYFGFCIHRFSLPLIETGLAQKSLEQLRCAILSALTVY